MIPPPTETTIPLNRQTLRRFGRAIATLAASEVGGRAKLLFAALLLFLFAINGLNVVNSYVGRDFMTAIAARSWSGFVSYAVAYVAVFAASTAVAVIYRFCEERLGLLWRGWLTDRLLDSYLQHPTVHRLNDRLLSNGEIANPDQRIADDVRAFTTTTLSFVLLFLNGTFTVVAFAGVMWSISPLLFVVGALYAVVGSLLTIFFGHPLVRLNYAQLDREAAFRADLVHLRQNAESVALSRSEEQVLARLHERVRDVVDNMRHIIAVNRNLGFFTTGYNYLIQIIPALIVAPLFIRGEVEFGVITQSAMAFSQLLGAFSLIVTQFQSISSFTAVIARIGSLAEAIEQAQAVTILSHERCGHGIRTVDCPICLAHAVALPALPTITIRHEDDRIAYEELTLRGPQDDQLLLADLTLAIPRGTRVLILGENDVGKLALFRVTAGIWDTGRGRVVCPPHGRIAFLAERPFLPPGTLRQLLVPPGCDEAVANRNILALATRFGLTPALARAGGVDAERDWNDLLSLGEQQLFAVVRLILTAPQFAFLDRPHTILGAEQVGAVLAALQEHAITYVTIGERDEPRDRYDATLEVRLDGSWAWTPSRAGLASATGV